LSQSSVSSHDSLVPGDAKAVSHAAVALSMAGRALDTNTAVGATPALAAVLLRESVVWVARSFGEPDIKGYSDALRSLEQGGVLERALGNRSASRAKLDGLDADSPPASLVADVEVSVTKLVECAQGKRTMARHEKAIRWAAVVLTIAVVSIVFAFTWMHPWRRYTFQTSSAYSGFKHAGQLGDGDGRSLLFHTEEEDDPWVDIDLHANRKIHSVVLKNRFDCCQFRGVPLVVEIGEGTEWQTVAERDETFDTWRADFPPVDARHVRIRSIGHTVLHLRGIEIR